MLLDEECIGCIVLKKGLDISCNLKKIVRLISFY